MSASLLMLSAVLGCGSNNNLPIAGQSGSPPLSSGVASSPPHFETEWFGPETATVAPGVHVLGELSPSAAYAIETSEGIVLIDSGVNENARLIRESLLAVNLKIEEIRYVLLTHAHYDHVLGANKVREVSGAIVCAGRGDCEVLRSADQNALFSLFPRQPYSGRPIQVDRELDDGDVIQVGDVTISVMGTPGHTPGSACYLIEKDGQRILLSGDVIASLNLGPATYPVHISPRYRGDARDYLGSVNRLLEMKPPDLLLPGHPRQQFEYESVRIEPRDWKTLLRSAQLELQTTVRRHQQDGADYLDGTAKEIEPGLFYLGDLDGTAVYWIQSEQHSIVINAPGGPRFAEFLSTQCQSLGLKPDIPSVVLLTSTAEGCHSGLQSLPTPATIVVPDSAVESFRTEKTPHVVSVQAIASTVDLPIEAIPLPNQENELLAFAFSIGSKKCLVTPTVPRNIVLVWRDRKRGTKRRSPLSPQREQLVQALTTSPQHAAKYQDALRKLTDCAPQIWLPSMPLTGQNANLYDDDWTTIVTTNLAAGEDAARILSEAP